MVKTRPISGRIPPKEKKSGLDESLVKKLEKAGKKEKDVKGWSAEQLMELDGIGKVTAEKIAKSV